MMKNIFKRRGLLNYFCEDCKHRKIPEIIKRKFNEEVKETFFECPLDNEDIIYCFVKFYRINWEKFVNYLIEEEKLTSEEIKTLKEEEK